MEHKKNDLCEVTITDIGMNGEGIGKYDGYTLFVKDALPGDKAKVKIMKAKKNYAYNTTKVRIIIQIAIITLLDIQFRLEVRKFFFNFS